MKRSSLWLGLLLVSLATVSAQVTVEVTQEQEQFLPGETLPVAVRITNLSGQTLHLGAESNWLVFAVQALDDHIVSQMGDVPVVGAFALESSKVAIKHVDLAPYFALSEPGRYAVTAMVRIPEWGREIMSSPTSFTIIRGAKLWEQEVGLPKVPGAASAVPEVRKYILQQANYLKGRIRLYLRVTDGTGLRSFRVVPIGPMVSFGRPEPQVDQLSNLHVLYQYGPHSFSYTVFDPAGWLLRRQTYDYIGTRPRLAVNQAGDIEVIGGVRRFTDSDVPPPKFHAPSDDAPKPATPSDEVKSAKP